MKIKLSHLCISCLTLALCQSAFALKSDSQKRLMIQSDQAQFYRKSGRGIFQGHVTLNQGTTRLHAKRLFIYTDKQRQLTKAIATGKPVIYHTVTAVGKPPLDARADKMIYQGKQHLITLIGHVTVKQGPNTFSGPKIIYNTLTKTVTSQPQGKQQTTIVIQANHHNKNQAFGLN